MRYSSTMITGTVLRGKGSRKKVPPLVVRPLRPFFLVVRPYPPPPLSGRTTSGGTFLRIP